MRSFAITAVKMATYLQRVRKTRRALASVITAARRAIYGRHVPRNELRGVLAVARSVTRRGRVPMKSRRRQCVLYRCGRSSRDVSES